MTIQLVRSHETEPFLSYERPIPRVDDVIVVTPEEGTASRWCVREITRYMAQLGQSAVETHVVVRVNEEPAPYDGEF